MASLQIDTSHRPIIVQSAHTYLKIRSENRTTYLLQTKPARFGNKQVDINVPHDEHTKEDEQDKGANSVMGRDADVSIHTECQG